MASEASFINGNSFVNVKGLARDGPWLLPSNRKLRHLQGISLRNLCLSRSSSLSRGKPTDDESLPNAFVTPTKLLAQRDNHRLGHSRSSIELKSPQLQNGSLKKGDIPGDTQSSRPNSKLRRRSTLNWTNAPPSVRQKRLENVTTGRMADTWFSLHCAQISEPLYISEVVEKAMNPSFRFFDLQMYGPLVTRSDKLTLKYWAKTEIMEEYKLLIEMQLHLGSLQFIGKTLESFRHPLPQNCIIFHMTDGIYTSFTDLPLNQAAFPKPLASKPLSQGVQSTSSFDALLQLSNLDDCIQDALSTREKLTTQINDILEKHREAHEIVNSSLQCQDSLAITNRSLTATRKQLRTTQARCSDLRVSLQTRRAAMTSGALSEEKAQSHLASAENNLSSQRRLLQDTKVEICGQIRRICEDLLSIYPIEPVPQKPLLFTIHSLLLPNANFLASSTSEADHLTTAAALSMVAHLTQLLSFYLSTPIPYPPTIHGSTSTILDPVSKNLHSLSARTFPLYQKGAVAFRFEYAVFLLNSDIQLLMSRQGLRMVDQRQTLPNLKYLLYVLSSGKGELPVRKHGDVKGLGGSGWADRSETAKAKD